MEDFDIIDINTDSKTPERKVDKLGRVRPSSYSRIHCLNETVRKKPCNVVENSNEATAEEDTNAIPVNEVCHLNDISYDENNTNMEETTEERFMPDIAVREQFHQVISEMTNYTSNIWVSEQDSDNEKLISDEKWKELTNQNGDDIFNSDDLGAETSSGADQNILFEENAPIYPGHSMTVYTSMVLILLYTIVHTTSGAQLSDLLTLISVHCMHPHPGLQSIYIFKQYFAEIHTPLKKHFFCKSCMSSVSESDKTCSAENCHKSLKDSKSKGYFIEIPLEDQLKNIMKRSGIITSLQERFVRKKKKNDGIEDIYDGQIYRKLSEPGGPLSEDFPYNISFTWNTDGIPVFKSSKFSLWPFYLVINELPYKQRILKENMILCGLWFGEVKPFMSLFTKPFTKSLKQLETIGIDYEVDGTSYLTKGYLICGTADLPAKSIVLNCNQFNGKYSCMRCMHPGETFKTNKGGCVHTFPYDASKPQFDKRTFQSCIEHAFTAIRDQKTTNGIKGPSFLMALKSYDFVKSNSIDYMHGVLLGITKLLIKLWISSGFSDQKFSVSKYVEIIDERLLQIKPPSFITRIPRTLSDHFKYWKASELRSWLYYYSLPVMFDILTPAYLMHYACFVQGIYLLSTDCVTTDDLKMSQSLLSYFVHMFPSLYGERYVTLNMHSLLHLTQCVEDLGPLWVYSCFPFENINGVLMELFHGTQNVELQIISSVNVLQNMPDILRNIDDPTVLKFIEKMKHKNLHHKIPAGTLSGSCPIGAGSNINLTEDLFGKLVTEVNFKPSKVFTYKRISHRGFILHSAAYTRVQVRNTFTVKFYNSSSKQISYGIIAYFILVKKCDCMEKICHCDLVLASVIEQYKEVKPSILDPNFLFVQVPHIKVATKTNILCVIDVSKIISTVVNVDFESSHGYHFLCEVPNLLESD